MLIDLNMKTVKSLKEGDMLICRFHGNQAVFEIINENDLLKETNNKIEKLKTMVGQLQDAVIDQLEENKKFKESVNNSFKKITAVLTNGKE